MDVYLDAVFNPNIYNNKQIFMQEGWHYEVNENNDLFHFDLFDDYGLNNNFNNRNNHFDILNPIYNIKMNRTRKKYSVSGALDHSISPNDPSDTSNLKKLSSNILNYIKIKEKTNTLLGRGAFSSVYLGKADVDVFVNEVLKESKKDVSLLIFR